MLSSDQAQCSLRAHESQSVRPVALVPARCGAPRHSAGCGPHLLPPVAPAARRRGSAHSAPTNCSNSKFALWAAFSPLASIPDSPAHRCARRPASAPEVHVATRNDPLATLHPSRGTRFQVHRASARSSEQRKRACFFPWLTQPRPAQANFCTRLHVYQSPFLSLILMFSLSSLSPSYTAYLRHRSAHFVVALPMPSEAFDTMITTQKSTNSDSRRIRVPLNLHSARDLGTSCLPCEVRAELTSSTC